MYLWQTDFKHRQQEYAPAGMKLSLSKGVENSRYSCREEWKQMTLTHKVQKQSEKCTVIYINFDEKKCLGEMLPW